MSRFKEKERIERAIETGVVSELLWAMQYCDMRLSLAQPRQHEKHWRTLLARVHDSMESGGSPPATLP
jgi:hypothetical protein